MSKYLEQKRATRKRLAALTPAQRRIRTAEGERQFGDQAKPYHVEQRALGLAYANTPKRQKLSKGKSGNENHPR